MYELVLYNITTENIDNQICEKMHNTDHLFIYALLPLTNGHFPFTSL